MLQTPLQIVIGTGIAAALVVFVSAFRYALRECRVDSEDIARAIIHDGARRWRRGAVRSQLRGQARRGVTVLQAGFVAVGITSTFVMTLCMAGVIVSLLAS